MPRARCLEGGPKGPVRNAHGAKRPPEGTAAVQRRGAKKIIKKI